VNEVWPNIDKGKRASGTTRSFGTSSFQCHNEYK